MKLYFLLTRKRLLLLLALLIVSLLTAGEFYSVKIQQKNADTHQQRMEFAAQQGYTIDTPCSVTKSRIPDNANGKFLLYRGCAVTVYRYPVAEEKADLDLTVYHGRVIEMRLTEYRNEDENG